MGRFDKSPLSGASQSELDAAVDRLGTDAPAQKEKGPLAGASEAEVNSALEGLEDQKEKRIQEKGEAARSALNAVKEARASDSAESESALASIRGAMAKQDKMAEALAKLKAKKTRISELGSRVDKSMTEQERIAKLTKLDMKKAMPFDAAALMEEVRKADEKYSNPEN